jgi:AcrR family transcriptional regulator
MIRGVGRRRRPSRGDLKEAEILDHAWELLGRKAVGEVTVEELAKGVGLSRPTFYFYFESREAVIRALAERVADGLLATVGVTAGEPEQPDEPDRVIRARVAAYMQRWRTEGRVLRAMVPLYESDAGHKAFWDDITDQLVTAIAGSIESERAEGRALPGPPTARSLAEALVAMLWRSGYELSLTPPSTEADEVVVDTLTVVCRRAIYGA